MRQRVVVLCLCVMALGSVSLAAAEREAVYPELAPLETDAALFSFCCEASGFEAPQGYALEGFRRLDLNGDGVTDVVAVLREGAAGGRLLVVMLSGPAGYGVTENPRALPAASGSDPLYGVEADVDCIKVYTRENRGEQLRSEYVFARDGERFALSRLTTLRWDEASGSAERERFDFALADTSVAPGTVESDTFSAAGDVERFAFEADTYATTLDLFEIDALPKTLEAFAERAVPVLAPAGAEPFQAQGARREANGEEEAPQALPEAPRFKGDAPDTLTCAACGGQYLEGEEFRNHACVPQEPERASRCGACGEAFDSEEALWAHACESAGKAKGEKAQCPKCGEWFPAGEEFDGHACRSLKPTMVQCAACGGWFAEGSAFRNHVCVSYPAEGKVYCDQCGGWYAEGDAFRNHVCGDGE